MTDTVRVNTLPLAIVIAVCFTLQFVVDSGLRNNWLGRRDLTSLLDPFAHFSLAVLVLLPWASAFKVSWKNLLIGLATSVMIDLDHFVAAGSLSLNDAITLSARPIAHSILFSIFASVGLGCLFRSRTLVWVVLVVLISHISRDASGGGTTPLFWPSDFVMRIPPVVHLGFWVMVSVSGLWVNSFRERASAQVL